MNLVCIAFLWVVFVILPMSIGYVANPALHWDVLAFNVSMEWGRGSVSDWLSIAGSLTLIIYVLFTIPVLKDLFRGRSI